MRIGELAKQADVNVQTVRYYERRGLLRPRQRLESGYREYGTPELERLLFIRRAQELGFTLNEIDELLTLRQDENTSAGTVKARAMARLSTIDAKITDLQRIRHALLHLSEQCRGGAGPMGECPLLEALGSENLDPRLSAVNVEQPDRIATCTVADRDA